MAENEKDKRTTAHTTQHRKPKNKQYTAHILLIQNGRMVTFAGCCLHPRLLVYSCLIGNIAKSSLFY